MRSPITRLALTFAAILVAMLGLAGPAAASHDTETYVGFDYQTSYGAWSSDPSWSFNLWNRDINGNSVQWHGETACSTSWFSTMPTCPAGHSTRPSYGKIGSNKDTGGTGYVETEHAFVERIHIPANWRMVLDFRPTRETFVSTVTVAGPRSVYITSAGKEWLRVEAINTNCGC